MFSCNYLQPIQNLVYDRIVQERQQYAKYYELIESYMSEFLKENVLILGGNMSIDLLLTKPRSYQDFVYELYSPWAFPHANNLANKLSEFAMGETNVFLKSAIANMKYQIFIDNRAIVTVYRLMENASNIISPLTVDSYLGKKILIIPPEIHLVDIYHTLMAPDRSDEWPATLHNENRLFHHLKTRVNLLSESTEVVEGSADVSQADKKAIELALLQKFVQGNEDIALIGEHALYILNRSGMSSTVIHVVSQVSADILLPKISAVIQKAVKSQIPVVQVQRKLYIMQDYRIKRTIIKIGDAENQKEVMYIYNSGEFDLIPFNTITSKEKSGTSIQMGNPFVIMRFLLIDLWMVRLISSVGGINATYAEQRQRSILSKLIGLRSNISSLESTTLYDDNQITDISDTYLSGANDLRVFQDDYIGQFQDENVSTKLLAKTSNKKYFDYVPEDYKKKNGEYRMIAEDIKDKL